MDTSADIYLTIISATIILLLMLATIISLLFIYQKRQIGNRLEMKNVKDAYENEILKTQLEIKEQTLKNISLDIHDNVGQILSLANLSLSSLDLKPDDPLKDKIESVMSLISKSIGDLRNLSKTLDPDNIAKEGLSACLQFELSLLEKMGVFTTRFDSTGKEPPLDSSKKLLIYRMVQEAINNIIKHSKATEVSISVSFDKNLNIFIYDNGIGFDHALRTSDLSRSGAGLQNMAYRAKLMKGNFFVESTPQQGTKINFEIPLTDTSANHEKN